MSHTPPDFHAASADRAQDAAYRRSLRKKSIERREQLSMESIAQYSKKVVDRILRLSAFKSASAVLVYSHINKELPLDALIEHPDASGKRFAFPLCAGPAELKALIPGDWRPGPFGIPEPDRQSSVEVMPEELDLVICPGTAFDADCHRLGMGAGYYDRYLPKCKNAVILMVAYEIQRFEHVPFGSWDFPMDMIITEERTYYPRQPRHIFCIEQEPT